MSEIEVLYHEQIKALAQAGFGHGRLAAPMVSVQLDNALCGDRIIMDLVIDSGRITELRHTTRGCLLCRASAALLAREAIGRSLAEIDQARQELHALLEQGAVPHVWTDLALFSPVAAHRSRHGCVLLPYRALEQATQNR